MHHKHIPFCCEQKHLMKNGAPPANFCRILSVEFHDFNNKNGFQGLSPLVHGIITIFLKIVWI